MKINNIIVNIILLHSINIEMVYETIIFNIFYKKCISTNFLNQFDKQMKKLFNIVILYFLYTKSYK